MVIKLHRHILWILALAVASASHAAPVTGPWLVVQGGGPVTSANTASHGPPAPPQLSDPNADADKDGNSNLLEYGAGTDALVPASRPAGTLTPINP